MPGEACAERDKRIMARKLPEVKSADLSRVDPAQFDDRDIEQIPYYLAHLHRIANAVVEEGEDRGFINLPVWRRDRDNQPYNVRIMENILSFAYFYCSKKSWNPYYGDEALRRRMETALEFWLNIQNEDGAFSEYAPHKWNLPGTAFATRFMGETLRLLADGPPIDREVHQRIIRAHRKAFQPSFGDGRWIENGASYTNQWGAYWPGALAHIDLFDDRKLDEQLRYWIDKTAAGGEHAFQSEAGYMTEKDGPAWGYTFGVHMGNVRMSWSYATGHGRNVMTEKDPELMAWLIREQKIYSEWLGYNALLEPDGSGFVLNSAIGTRHTNRSFVTSAFPMGDAVEGLRPYLPTREQVQRRRAAARSAAEAKWPVVPELGHYSPHVFEQREHEPWYPTEDQRKEAREKLPYLASDNFTHQRADDRYVFTYVRRPGYYAAFSIGERGDKLQRLGLGLIWHPQAGTLIQTPREGILEAWGTRAENAENVYEASDIMADIARFTLNGENIAPAEGVRDLLPGEPAVEYPLGNGGNGKKVNFTDDLIAVEVSHAGAFREQLPLLVREKDRVVLDDETVYVERNGVRLAVRFEGSRGVSVVDGDSDKAKVIVAEGAVHLKYTLRFETR